MAANPLVYKWLSALLCYPEANMLDALPEFQTALDEWPELAAERAGLQALLDHLKRHSLRELQEDYVLVFDRNRRCFGVLDADSDRLAQFDETDARYLNQLAELVGRLYERDI